MIKSEVKMNKSSGVKFIYLPKDCGYQEGDEVEINYNGFGIYNMENLKKYYEENKQLFKNLKEIRDNLFEEIVRKEIIFFNSIAGKIGLGEFKWEEECYFKGSKYSFSIEGDIEVEDQKIIADLHISSHCDIEETINKYKLSKEEVNNQIKDFTFCLMVKNIIEEKMKLLDTRLKEELNKKGFSLIKNNNNMDNEIYSNGILNLIINYDECGVSYYITTKCNQELFRDKIIQI